MSGTPGKRCLVLGGSGNIGGAICRTLAREGAQVAFTYHRGQEAARALSAALGGAASASCDFTQAADVARAVSELAARLGGLDALIWAAGNAGRKFDLALREVTARDLDESFELNARGFFLACQAAQAELARAGGGNVVAVGTLDGVKAVPTPAHIATSKSSLKGMVEALARELGDAGTRVNLLACGIVEGGASRHLTETMKAEYLKHCSMKRFGRPSEIAEVASWLALENTFVSGQAILLNGGL